MRVPAAGIPTGCARARSKGGEEHADQYVPERHSTRSYPPSRLASTADGIEEGSGAHAADPAGDDIPLGRGAAGGTYALVVHCNWDGGGVTRSVGLRGIETGSNSATLPAIPGLTIAAGAACDWQVLWRARADPALESRWSSSAQRHATFGP